MIKRKQQQQKKKKKKKNKQKKNKKKKNKQEIVEEVLTQRCFAQVILGKRYRKKSVTETWYLDDSIAFKCQAMKEGIFPLHFN